MNRLPCEIYFAGTLEEYSKFQGEVAKATYLKVNDFLDLAEAIASCKVFIGNQSFCFSLAEAVKSHRVLEVCSYAPNVIPCGANGYDFYDTQTFEILVNKLIN